MVNKFYWHDLSKYRNELFGVSILSILAFHLSEDITTRSDMASNISLKIARLYDLLIGSIGVDAFIVLSAIGLYFSLSHDSDLRKYYFKRFRRILPEYFIVAFLLFFIRDMLITKIGVGGILRDIFAISFVRNGDRSLWYVYFIAFSYLIYPALFKVRNYKNGGVQILLLMLTSIFLILTFQHLLPNLYENIEIAIARIPILLAGIYISPYIYEKKPLNKKECFTLVFIILLKAIKILNGRIGLHFPVIFNNRIIDTYFAIPLLFVAVELLKKVQLLFSDMRH